MTRTLRNALLGAAFGLALAAGPAGAATIKVGVVAPFSMLVPVVGISTAWLVLGERPGPLELVGGAIGNMICVNNVVAVCATVGCPDAEGIIIRRNSIPCFIYAIIVAAVMAYLISKGFNPLPLKL